ncbi:unnamed protein product [Trifolium pratense]|uniref:Uncharacterized protein n=1 Tax=Trifolium pratense TaxID=57577 RepID=A0ACB0J8A3_TRIPR|nr:unnamed protein product [Trifolium pratense]
MSHLDHVESRVPDFEELVMSGNWKDIINLYKSDKNYQTLKVKNRGTALHVAVSNGDLEGVKLLVNVLLSMWKDDDKKHPLRRLNERGSTPLHIAAYRGFLRMCQYIIGENGERKDLITINNDDGETPLFWAVQGNSKKTFVYLHNFFPHEVNLVMDYKGTTILHVAIQREMFDLANIIMHCYASSKINSEMNENGVTPLGELATRTSAFECGNHLSWWEKILYKCFPLKLQDAKTEFESLRESVKKGPYLLKTRCHNRCCTCCTCILVGPTAELDAAQSGDISIQLSDVEEIQTEDKVESIFDQLFKWPIVSLLNLDKIKITKRKCLYANRLLDELMVNFNESYWGGGDEPPDDEERDEEEAKDVMKIGAKYHEGALKKEYLQLQNTTEESTSTKESNDTICLIAARNDVVVIMQELISKLPITSNKKRVLLEAMMDIETKLLEEKNVKKNSTYLVAAKHGIVEITRRLEENIIGVIHDRNSNDENVLLLAVKYRQPQIVEELHSKSSFKDKSIFTSLCQQVDNNGNTMLHLAAYTSLNKETTWTISGPAMQMMCDVKWYKYIQRTVPRHFKHRTNKDEKTPGEIFKEEHEELLQKSTDWLKDTAESCSVVAALIAGLSFATSGSVPGGNNDSGKPTLEGQPAFEGFAVSSLIGLYSSGIALIMFLSILTSRKQIEDFGINLPAKLLAGLTSLFISIVAMFISFCSGHFFVLTDKYAKHDILFYLFIAFSIPVIFYGAMQLPLYIDLLNIILKKSPPPSIKGVHL